MVQLFLTWLGTRVVRRLGSAHHSTGSGARLEWLARFPEKAAGRALEVAFAKAVRIADKPAFVQTDFLRKGNVLRNVGVPSDSVRHPTGCAPLHYLFAVPAA